MKRELLYVQVGEDKFIAGTNLEKMISSIEDASNIYSQKKLSIIRKEDIPKKYSWSIKRVEEYYDWEEKGAYQLIPNFETCSRFEKYFPEKNIENKPL